MQRMGRWMVPGLATVVLLGLFLASTERPARVRPIAPPNEKEGSGALGITSTVEVAALRQESYIRVSREASVRVEEGQMRYRGTHGGRFQRFDYRMTPIAGVREGYRKVEGEIEQYFVLSHRPERPGDLTIEGRVETNLRVLSASTKEVVFGRKYPELRIHEAVGVDAAGRKEPLTLAYDGDRRLLSLTASGAWLEQASYPVVLDPLIGPALPVEADVVHLVSDQIHGSYGGRFLKIGSAGGPWGQFLRSSDGSVDGARFSLPNIDGDVAYLPSVGKYLVVYPGADGSGNAALWSYLIDGTTGIATVPQVAYARVDPDGISTSFLRVGISATAGGWAVAFLADPFDFETGIQTLRMEVLTLTSAGSLLSGPVVLRSVNWDVTTQEDHFWSGDRLRTAVLREEGSASDRIVVTWKNLGLTSAGSEVHTILAAAANLSTMTVTRAWNVETFTIPVSSDELSTVRNPVVTADDGRNEFLIAWTRVNADGLANVSAARFNSSGSAIGSRFFVQGSLSQIDTDFDFVDLAYSPVGDVHFVVWNEDLRNVHASTVGGGTSLVVTADIPIAATVQTELARALSLNRADAHALILLTSGGASKAQLYEIQPVAPLIRINNGDSFTASTGVSLSLLAVGAAQMRFSNDGGAWSAWETYATSRSWMIAAGEGAHSVSVQFRDAAGNVSAILSDSIVLDLSVPTGSVTIQAGASFTASTAVTLTLSAQDAGSGVADVRLSNDGVSWGAWQSFAASATWGLTSGDGTKMVYAQFRDAAGNLSTPAIDSILLDTTGPAGSVVLNSGAATTNFPVVTLSLSLFDNGTGLWQMRLSNDGGAWGAWQSVASSASWTLASVAGTRTVSVQVMDNAGNTSATISDTITLEPALWINGNGTYATSSALNLGIVGPSGSAFLRVSEDGITWSPWETYSTSRVWGISPGEGNRTIQVQVGDSAQGVLATYTDSIIVDTVAPAASVLLNQGALYTMSREVTLQSTVSDATSGVSEMKIWTGTHFDWIPFQASLLCTITQNEGNRAVSSYFRDRAGNVSSLVWDFIILDLTPPVNCSILINDGADSTASATVSLLPAASDALSGVASLRYSYDNITWGTWGFPQGRQTRTLPAGDGIKWVYAQYRDGAGNISAACSDSILLDTIGPSGSVTINAGAPSTNTPTVTLTLAAVDGGTGVSLMRFSDPTTPWGSWESFAPMRTWTFPSAEGNRVVYVQYRDVLGNQSTTYSDMIVVDPNGPTGSVTINNGAAYATSTSVSLGLFATDSLSTVTGMRFSNDSLNWGTWIPYGFTAPWTLESGDGPKTVYAQFRDSLGNVSGTVSDAILLETIAPSVMIAQAAGQMDPTYVATIVFAVTFSEPVTGFDATDVVVSGTAGAASVTIGGTGPSYTATVTGMAGAGTVMISIPAGRVSDAAGNSNSASTNVDNSVLFDPTAPVGSVVIDDGAPWTNTPGVVLTLTADDPETGVTEMQLSNDNVTWSEWMGYEDRLQWGLAVGEGTKTVYVRLRNGAGNVSAVISDSILIDGTGPTGSVVINGGAAFSSNPSVSLGISASDAVSGVTQMRFSNDNVTWGAWTSYATTASWTLSAGDGTKSVFVQFQDGVGHTSAAYADTILLDTVGPSGSVVINGGAASTTQTAVTLSLSTTDSGSGTAQMRFSNDNVTWSAWTAYATSAGWTLTSGGGTRTVFAQFKDGAGNVSAVVSDTIQLNSAAFAGTVLIDGNARFTYSYNVTLTLTAGGGAYPVSRMRFSNDNVTWTAWETFASSKAWTLSTGSGTKTVYAQFLDTAGTVSPVASDTIQKYVYSKLMILE